MNLGGVDVKSFLDYWAVDEINGNLGTHLLCFAPSSHDDDLDVPWVWQSLRLSKFNSFLLSDTPCIQIQYSRVIVVDFDEY